MPDCLYLATNERATGKRLVALGMMESITRRFGRIAFFRPILTVDSVADKNLNESLQSIRIGNDGLRDRGVEILATIVNQVSPTLRDALQFAHADGRVDRLAPVYFIP
jgi:BioD-like phosphotransacetylase family protein